MVSYNLNILEKLDTDTPVSFNYNYIGKEDNLFERKGYLKKIMKGKKAKNTESFKYYLYIFDEDRLDYRTFDVNKISNLKIGIDRKVKIDRNACEEAKARNLVLKSFIYPCKLPSYSLWSEENVGPSEDWNEWWIETDKDNMKENLNNKYKDISYIEYPEEEIKETIKTQTNKRKRSILDDKKNLVFAVGKNSKKRKNKKIFINQKKLIKNRVP